MMWVDSYEQEMREVVLFRREIDAIVGRVAAAHTPRHDVMTLTIAVHLTGSRARDQRIVMSGVIHVEAVSE